VMYLYRDRRGTFWISTANGLSRYENGKFTTFTTKDGLPTNRVGALLEDRDGNLWIGTAAGLCRYVSGKFSTLSTRDGLSGEQVVAIYEDGEGSLWVGTFGGGLTRLIDGKFLSVTKREGLGEDAVSPIFQDRDDAIWIGTMGGGVSRILNGKMTTFTARQGLASDYVDAICQDHQGRLWFGTSSGLTRLDRGKFTTLTKKDGLAGMTIMTVAEDRDGALWIGYGAAGLDRMKDGKITHYTKADGLAHDAVRSLFTDKDGALWIGTFGGGVSRFQNGRFTTFSTRNGLPHDVVGKIVQDVRGSIWLCTIGGGLIRYRDGAFKQITTKNGLFDDTIYALLEDNQGNFWMSCNNGISRVSHFELDAFCDGKIASVKALPFGENDGMRNRECNYGSPPGLKARNGTLWFPTLGGVATIDPARIRFNRVPPPVILERAMGDQRALPRTGEARVRPGKGELEFHYAALSYIAPSRVRFRYRLEGFEKQWVEAGTRRVAYYTNIPPGRYTFRVTACNNDGVWSREGTTLPLRIEPHFYQTWLFYVCCAGLLGFLVVWLHRVRVRRLEEHTRELRHLVDERTRAQEELAESNRKLEKTMEELRHAQGRLVQQERLRALGQMASGVTHDFNNALTPILGFTDFLLARPQILEDREKTLAYLANVNTAAKDASQVVKRLREFYRPRDEAEVFPLVSIDAILRQAVSLTQPKWKDQAQARGVSIEVATELKPTPLIPGSESALREMLTNMIFNAVDAMPQGGTITLRSRVREGWIVIEVADTGTGMTEEVRARCLEPFFTTKGEEGTGLGLPMVYGIVGRHGGTIEIDSAPGRGTTFRALLPVEASLAGQETPIAFRAPPPVPPLRVLVVED
ncbi:MAG TPA: two-component regulator propeller domain-containing protein, partial [Candidatus Polarisedimenticolia bacterium]|nr:two-component regulator propeller domain-containing protein [Candidatus Polarisedimenticolia bacterium]